MMGRIYFDQAGPVKPQKEEEKGIITYHITVAGQRLSVRATHHGLLDMLPGIMRDGGRVTQELHA